MIIPVWGMEYVERWLALSFASLRSAGNIGYVNEHCRLELAIVTTVSDAASMRADTRFATMTEGLRVKILSMDEFFPPHGQVTYGMPLTLAYAKGIADLGTDGLGSFVILMNADFIVSTGSLKSVVDRINQGFAIVTAPSIRVIDADVRPLLLARADPEAGVMSISSREMMRIVNAHLHNTVRARTVNEHGYIDASHYHTIYWRLSEDSLAARYFLLMPLCFRVDRLMDKVVCPVDYGFITETCPGGRFTALTDSDDFMMLELQDQDSEAYLLRIPRKTSTLDERLAFLEQEISSQTAGWATAEHRRSVTQALYFHERELPIDIADRVAPFNAFMDRMLARMPPPVSYTRHFHWLGAVYSYRQRMLRGGASGVVEMLEDARNGARPTLEELSTPTVWSGGRVRRLLRYVMQEATLRAAGFRGWARRLLVRKPRRDLAALLAPALAAVSGRNAVAYLFDTERYAPAPPAGAIVLRFPRPFVPLSTGGFRLSSDDDAHDGGDRGTLLLYAPLNFISHWPRMAKDIARTLQTYRQVIVVLVLPNYLSARLADYAWVLSRLMGWLGSVGFEVRLDPFPGRASHPLRVVLSFLSPRSWINAPQHLGRLLAGSLRAALSYQSTNFDGGPTRFGALILRATRASAVGSQPGSAHAAFWAATS
jgi:hypothetical protein